MRHTHVDNSSIVPDADGPAAQEVQVWDPLVRLFHWGLGLAFLTAYLTEDDLLEVHVKAGYVVLSLVLFRILWGLIGPPHARWSSFVQPPAVILEYLRDIARSSATRYIGHNPAGGAMVVALMVALLGTTLTGLSLYGAQELSGPLAGMMSGLDPSWGHELEDIHELMANLTLGLVLLHVVGVILASFQHDENLIRSMITGDKRK